jgi:hypothetical protein
MAFVNLKETETERLVTLPNMMTFARGIGGIVLGAAMWRHGIDPYAAAGAVVGAGVSDAEGNLIKFFNDRPRLSGIRNKLRIHASKFGRKGDPVADRLFVVGALAGGLAGSYLPLVDVAPVLASEALITGVSLTQEAQGHDVQVNKWGKGGLLARGTMLVTDIAASGMHGTAQEVTQTVGHGLAAAAVGMAVLNVYTLVQQARSPQEQSAQQEPSL